MTVRTPRTVTSEQREQFDRDGYLMLGDVGCAESLLDGVLADLKGRYQGEYRLEPDGVHYSRRRIMNFWKVSHNVRALALSPKVMQALADLYGRRPLPFQTLNFRVGSEQPAHSDTLHFNSSPPGYMCGVWVALEDVDMDNGPVVYYPGSHKLPEVTLEDVGPTADQVQYSDHIAELIEREGLAPSYATMKKGEAFIWAANLLHGGHPRRERRTRHSQVTHFFFEGCRYHSPLRAIGGEPHWIDPQWIV